MAGTEVGKLKQDTGREVGVICHQPDGLASLPNDGSFMVKISQITLVQGRPFMAYVAYVA